MGKRKHTPRSKRRATPKEPFEKTLARALQGAKPGELPVISMKDWRCIGYRKVPPYQG